MIPRYGLLNQDPEIVNYVLNYTQEGDAYYENYIDIKAGARDSLGVICFTSKEDNILMWSHYADNHEGICIEFDANSKFFNGKYRDRGVPEFIELQKDSNKDIYDNVGILSKIEYSEKRHLIYETKELIDDTCSWLVKSKEWEYEDEYRIILSIDFAIEDKDMYFYKVNKRIIKSIILGCKVPKKTKIEIAKECDELNIRLKESFINEVGYKLDIMD